MPKDTYLTMYIDRTLKTQLQKLAQREGHPTLTEFVCKEIKTQLDAREPVRRGTPLPPRSPRSAYLLMWVDAGLKKELLRLADEDYRTLTDYVELQLRRVVQSGKEVLGTASNFGAHKRAGSGPASKASRDRIAISLGKELKVQLQQLAAVEFRSLTNFIEVRLHQVVAAAGIGRVTVMRRQRRDARLVMRVTPSFKSSLSGWADSEYRTLTDFVELRLHEVVARFQRPIGDRASGGAQRPSTRRRGRSVAPK